MRLTNRQVLDLYKFLTGLEQEADEWGKLIRVNRSRIADKSVRSAVIDNIVALAPVYDEIQKQESILRSQYFTENYLELYRQFLAANDINDTTKIKEMHDALKEAEKPFASDYLTSREKLLNREQDINLTQIERNRFDAATETCCFSMRVYSEFVFMFKNKEVSDEKN